MIDNKFIKIHISHIYFSNGALKLFYCIRSIFLSFLLISTVFSSDSCKSDSENYADIQLANAIIDEIVFVCSLNAQEVCIDEKPFFLDLSHYKALGIKSRDMCTLNFLSMNSGFIRNYWLLMEPLRFNNFLTSIDNFNAFVEINGLQFSSDSDLKDINFGLNLVRKNIVNNKYYDIWKYISELNNVIRITNINDRLINLHLLKNIASNEIILYGYYDTKL